MGDYQISGGEMSWDELCGWAVEGRWTWIDLDGVQLDVALPRQAPHTSLLHGWCADPQWASRVRLAGGRAYVSVIGQPGGVPPSLEQAQGLGEVTESIPWPGQGRSAQAGRLLAERNQKGALAQVFDQLSFYTLSTNGSSCITFLAPQGAVDFSKLELKAVPNHGS